MKAEKIIKEGIVLAEGLDIKMFCVWACVAYQFENIQVFDFGGIKDLTSYLNTFRVFPNYETVKNIVVIRDAEKDADAAIKSIQRSFKQASLSEPQSPYEFINGNPKTAFAILPGTILKDSPLKYENGTLEDLCMSIIHDPQNTISCVESFLTEVNQCGCTLSHIHKSKLHAYLSVQNSCVGMKIGEAAKANAWNWDHPNMDKLKKLLSECNNI